MQERKIIKNCSSFRDLDLVLKKLIKNKKSKLAGSIFENLVKLYFQVAPEYKTKLSKVYLLNEVPIYLKDKLRLPNTDEGIDLIAETFDKEYWAIQCKYRSDNSETLKVKGDLATFNNLAFTMCKNISHGIVCATINKPPKKNKLLKVGYILLDQWLKLDENNREIFRQIKNKAAGKIILPKKLTPRPHQKKAIDKSLSHFKDNDKGKIIMPCGTGKSLTAFWIAKELKSKSILIAVPSLALLQQTLRVWTREFYLNNIFSEWLCVCSDDTVSKEQDDFITLSSDLGIKVDTNPKIIRKFLRKKTNKLKIVFTTYQSGKATCIGSKGFSFDLGIMDEAHKTVGKRNKPMAQLIQNKNIKIKKRLFMTATERLFNRNKNEHLSMDNEEDYGKLIYSLSFKEAINSIPKIISDYQIITFGISDNEIRELHESNKFLEVKSKINNITARELATALSLRKSMKEMNIKNAITFHSSIERAKNFQKQQQLISEVFPSYKKINSFHISGEMPAYKRSEQLRMFENKKGLITNARCLTEGIDLPAIDCVCFTDPKRSKVDIVQAAGRALRLSKGKKFGYILIPIHVPNLEDIHESAESQGYDDILNTIGALSTHDSRIAEYLKAISEGRRPKRGSPIEGTISLLNLTSVDSEKFDKAIKIKIWKNIAHANPRSYQEAKKWIKPYRLKSQREYRNFYNKNKDFPLDVPKTPQKVYQNFSWGDYLSTGFIATRLRKYREYKKAQKYFISKKKINSQTDFNMFKKDEKFPSDIPRNPGTTYAKSWKGWGIFLTGKKTLTNAAKKALFVNYKTFEKKIRDKNINTLKKFVIFSNSSNYPVNLPKAPDQQYKNKGWINFPTLFGRPKFVELVQIIHNKKNILTKAHYINYIKSIRKKVVYPYPRNPDMVYDKEFKKKGGWYYFLGIKSKLGITEADYDPNKVKNFK